MILTNQQVNKLNAPVQAAHGELEAAEADAAATPARIRLGDLAPDMARLDAETKQITHAIRMAAYNAETILARALDGHYARARDEAYALIREALATSGDIHPGPGQAAHPARPADRPAAHPCNGRPLRPAQPGRMHLSRHRPHPALRGQAPPRPCMIFCPMSRVLGLQPGRGDPGQGGNGRPDR